MTTMIFMTIAGLAILAGLKPTQRQVELALEQHERRRRLAGGVRIVR
ncbi:MAG TPA: hypothetical protein VF188_15900 [Longimicrobiales bacterium]